MLKMQSIFLIFIVVFFLFFRGRGCSYILTYQWNTSTAIIILEAGMNKKHLGKPMRTELKDLYKA